MRPYWRKIGIGSLILAIALVAFCLMVPGATYVVLAVVLTPIFFAAALFQRP